ncbi:MAG: gltX [Candidatus Saccharibacteria bacterium]|nr:gltX [Candidatus Saccharibacteria bacterium]
MIRTRFAPSPTGFLHVGGVRTALFAWLLARQNDGQFILRIEDTDKVREVVGAEAHIQASLKWVGIEWNEGTDIGGPHAPYRQSERLDLYHAWAQKLVDSGRAYADPYTPEQVEGFREEAKRAKRPFLYRDHRPDNPPTWDGSQPLRLKSEPKAYQWHDAVMGDLSTGPEAIDDFVLMKSDGYPTYNFCHIVDDAVMEITHVIRSQEFISSVPKYLNLYEALGVAPPTMATLPYVMAIDGKKKLGKRDGARDILDYAREGFLPEAMLNFLATLGWNDGTEQEIFTKNELIEKFSLDRVQRSGARFDEQRLQWMNGYWIRRLDLDDLYQRATDFWPPTVAEYDEDYKKKVLGLIQERLKFLAEVPALTEFFFSTPAIDPELITTHKQLKKCSTEDLRQWLQTTSTSLEGSDFSNDDLTTRLNDLLETTGQKPAVLFSLIRIAITQAPSSPGLADTLAVLGKERSLERIRTQLAAL